MSKRLQVLLDEGEFREIRMAARARKMTVAGWARQALLAALYCQPEGRQPKGDPRKKIEAIRAASLHAFPVGEVEPMLGEIERGYLSGGQ